MICKLSFLYTGLLLVFALTAGAASPSRHADFDEKPWDKLSDTEITDWGRKALAINRGKWKHGETDHFIIHYFRSGEMIARRSEKFYDAIREFFGNRKDRREGHRSHIFAFYEPSDWSTFKTAAKLPTWTGGITRGNEFFYPSVNEEKQFDARGHTQAHEMTHLVFNRFFTGRPPLWLNEGVAEYFGQIKTSDVTTFRRTVGRSGPFGLDRLFKTKEYPKNDSEVHSFYAEATIVVDFLTHTTDRRALLPKFIDAMIADPDVDEALKLYSYKTHADFQKAYDRYRMLFPRQ